MESNDEGDGGLPVLASRQTRTGYQADSLTQSRAESEEDLSPASSHGGAASLPPSASQASPRVPPRASGGTRAVDQVTAPPDSVPAPGSSADVQDHVATPSRPKTRLQSGIVKPKIYTDGTM
jgi:hypothetical protein